MATKKKTPKKKATKKKSRRKPGRPTKYSKALSDEVCAELAQGNSMRTVCSDAKMPNCSTIFRWLRTNDEFREQYEKAKQESADALVDEMLDIADDGTNDWMEKRLQNGETIEVLNAEHVQRSRLRLDARKWIASKLKPKKYGDKVQHSNDEDNPLPPALVVNFPDADKKTD